MGRTQAESRSAALVGASTTCHTRPADDGASAWQPRPGGPDGGVPAVHPGGDGRPPGPLVEGRDSPQNGLRHARPSGLDEHLGNARPEDRTPGQKGSASPHVDIGPHAQSRGLGRSHQRRIARGPALAGPRSTTGRIRVYHGRRVKYTAPTKAQPRCRSTPQRPMATSTSCCKPCRSACQRYGECQPGRLHGVVRVGAGGSRGTTSGTPRDSEGCRARHR